MSDKPRDPKKDSFAGRLNKALGKKPPGPSGASTGSTPESPSQTPPPASAKKKAPDSFVRRLNKALGAAPEPLAATPGAPASPDSTFEPPDFDSNKPLSDATTDAPVALAVAPTAGARRHVVKQGDCMNKIAALHGFFWDTLWNLPENGPLREKRLDPNVLLPGDEVHIRVKRRKEEPGETEMIHRFRAKGRPARLVLKFLDDGEPLANQPYEIRIDDKSSNGTTDGEGAIDVPIPNGAKRAIATVGPPDRLRRFKLALGSLDPHDSVSGVQARLRNLGYDPGPIDGKPGALTRKAVSRFQHDHNLPATGEIDLDTCATLKDEHGS